MTVPVRRVLISGVGGFVGRTAARQMARSRVEIVGLFRNTIPTQLAGLPGVTLLRANLDDPAAELPPDIDSLIHCASEVPATCPDESVLIERNVTGTRRLFDHARRQGVRRIIYCSSMAVYGTIDVDVVRESTPIRGPGAYGRSKLEGERMLDDLALSEPGLRAVSVRLPGVVGAGCRNNFLCNTLPKMLAGEAVMARNPDALFNNIVHVEDLAAFFNRLIPDPPTGHTVSLIGASEPITIRQLLSTMCRAAGVEENVTYSTGGRPFLIDTERVRYLGFRPPPVRDIVARFAQDWLAMDAGAT